MTNLYAVLGLSPAATSEEIKTAYRALAKRMHPDVSAGRASADGRIKEINGAYETLGDPELRSAYDVELAQERAEARRAFWTSAAAGAATFVLTVSCVSVLAMWRLNGPVQAMLSHHSVVTATIASSGPALEGPVALPPAAASPAHRVAQREAAAYAATPLDVGRRLQAPAADTDVSRGLAERGADRRRARAGSAHDAVERQFGAAKHSQHARGGGLLAFEKRPGPASRSVTALRWPSADEPFVYFGSGNR